MGERLNPENQNPQPELVVEGMAAARSFWELRGTRLGELGQAMLAQKDRLGEEQYVEVVAVGLSLALMARARFMEMSGPERLVNVPGILPVQQKDVWLGVMAEILGQHQETPFLGNILKRMNEEYLSAWLQDGNEYISIEYWARRVEGLGVEDVFVKFRQSQVAEKYCVAAQAAQALVDELVNFEADEEAIREDWEEGFEEDIERGKLISREVAMYSGQLLVGMLIALHTQDAHAELRRLAARQGGVLSDQDEVKLEAFTRRAISAFGPKKSNSAADFFKKFFKK